MEVDLPPLINAKTGDEQEDENLIKPRPYQELMKDICIKKNTIIYLPTGAGKTYIAIMTIKHYAKDLEKSLSAGGKRTIFVVNTVALARQQADVLRKRFPPEMVGLYSGDMNVDNWKRDKWREEFEKIKIVVATVQIIVDCITCGYLSIADINVLVVDECHWGAKGDHPMRQLMQKFSTVPDKSRHPRVIGLTGILLKNAVEPSSVEKELSDLEMVYHATISTVENSEEYNSVMEYSTDPTENVIYYTPLVKGSIFDALAREAQRAIDIVEGYRLENLRAQKAKTLKLESPSKVKDIRSLLKDFLYQMDDLGIYGASVAILACLVEFELGKRQSESRAEANLFRVAICACEKIRRMLVKAMDCCESEHNKMIRFGSPKLASLLQYLSNYVSDETAGKELKCLIFVERRHTAKVIYHIIKKIFNEKVQHDEGAEPSIRPDFMVGNRGYIPESIEVILSEKNNRRVLEKFRKNETNVIVCSSVLEEGIDLQSCNLVIRFDKPNSFSAYVQTKGRARMRNSQYVLMINRMDAQKMMLNITKFKLCEKKLKECLIGKTINRKEPDEVEISREVYMQKIPPFFTRAGASLTALSALQLLNRYAMLMPHDQFTNTSVFWERIDHIDLYRTNLRYSVKLYLPVQSTIKEPIESDKWESLKLAKRHAAFLACKKLYLNGELTDHLMPIDTVKKMENMQNVYFPHWENFLEDNAKLAGRKQQKRVHELVYAEELLGCTPSPNKINYLYVLSVTPIFNQTLELQESYDVNRKVFHELLGNQNCFAILTTKKIPNLPAIRTFLSLGEVQVQISKKPVEVELTAENLHHLLQFHTMLFRNLLGITQSKNYLAYDCNGGSNSYMIVPVKALCIDWESVRNFQCLSECREKSERERSNMTFKPEDYLYKVIQPWHKTQATKYIVTRVHKDLTPFSPFPETDYDSYAHYFAEKYKQRVVRSDQFMLETKAVTSSLNFLTPGSGKDGADNKYVNDFTSSEMYVPELCHNYMFPADLWLKAILLPSTLHRLSYLLLAERLRVNINKALGFSIAPTESPLDVDVRKQLNERKRGHDQIIADDDSDEEDLPLYEQKLAPITYPKPDDTPKHIDNALESLTDAFSNMWNPEQEPIDIDRNWDIVHEFELDYYVSFITKEFENQHINQYIENAGQLGNQCYSGIQEYRAITDTPSAEKFEIKLLGITNPKGPELKDVLKAITTTSAGDVFNLERYELLGDSFLKFSISLYLLFKHKEWHEGYLTGTKGRLVSNRNLFYLGQIIQIPGMLKQFNFDPKNDWIPPLFTVPEVIKEYMVEANVTASSLYSSVELTENEIRTGVVSAENQVKIIGRLQRNRNTDARDGSMKTMLGQQHVSDKAVADSMESILGVYLAFIGIEKAFDLLPYLRILPADPELLPNLLKTKMDSPRVKSNATAEDIDAYLVNHRNLEKALGYTFNDRSYLLQALTHPSFPASKYGCYQQLEFIGDAILDFLISTYIFQKCEIKDPGELTDLRSALVNNNTLACISVRNKFHMYILSQNALLDETIGKFVDYQKANGNRCTDQVELLVTEDDKLLADFVDVPKVLGDVFESLIGAVFFDSGNNFYVTWKVIYTLMQNEILEFLEKVPKQLVRRLFEYQPNANPKYGSVTVHQDFVQINLQFTCKNEILEVHGFGQNKEDAKRAAAKAALQRLERAHACK